MRAKDPDRYERRRLLSDSLGRFYFRYPNGESRADVVQRMATFLGKVHRSRYPHHVVFLHGVTQRAFRMARIRPRAGVVRVRAKPPERLGAPRFTGMRPASGRSAGSPRAEHPSGAERR